MKQKSAFTLVEILFASGMILVLFMGFVTMSLQSHRQTVMSRDKLKATFYARETIDAIRGALTLIDYEKLGSLSNRFNGDSFFEIKTPPDLKVDVFTTTLLKSRDNGLNSASTVFLSKMPNNFQRLVKISPSFRRYNGNPDLYNVEVQIRWKQDSKTYNRQVRQVTVVGANDTGHHFEY